MADPEDDPGSELVEAPPKELAEDEELPVVARLVVEIRSDGRRTIARGGLEDLTTGQKVAIDARGSSPVALALALARSILQVPRLAARSTLRGLLGRKKP